MTWDSMFFRDTFSTPLTKESIPQSFNESVFEAIRWAPSARNRQEWRVVVTATSLHFFVEDNPFGMIDAGIAVANAHVSLEANHVGGHFTKVNEAELAAAVHAPPTYKYCISYVVEVQQSQGTLIDSLCYV